MSFAIRLVGALSIFMLAACAGGDRPAPEKREGATAAVRALELAPAPGATTRPDPMILASPMEASGAFRPLSPGFWAKMPRAAAEPIVIEVPSRPAISVVRRGLVTGAAEIEDGMVVYDEPSQAVASVSYPHDGGFEELFVVRRATSELGYDIALPDGWRVGPARDHGARVEIVDERDRPVIRVTAARAWDRDGDPVAVALRPDDRGIALEVAAGGDYPLVIDPTWVDATVPLKLRTSQTTTLLASGELLVVGGYVGGAPDATTEVYHPQTGASRLAASLPEARAQHTASMLLDGRVLVTGGFTTSGFKLTTTEIFDPSGGSRVAGPTMLEERAQHTATVLDDGRVIIAGPYSTAVEVFDPEANVFEAAGTLAATFEVPPAAALLEDGRILYVGYGGGAALSLVYDPATGTSTVVAPPTELEPGDHSLTRLRDGRVLLAGGCPCFSVGGPTFSSAVAYLFNPATDGWTRTDDLVNARTGHSATLLPNGQVLFAGGVDFAENAAERTNAELFDPATDTFSLVAGTMNAPRGNHTATLLPTGDVLLLGGTQAAAELYVGGGAAGGGATLPNPDMTRPREDHTATVLLDGRVLLAGGISFDATSPDAELYDPVAHSFTPVADAMVAPRHSHVATLLADGRVLIAGGSAISGDATTIELFDPATDTFEDVGAVLSTSRTRPSATLLRDGRVLIAGGTSQVTAEIFDPATDTLGAPIEMAALMEEHGDALLPDGRVLLVGRYAAQIFDPSDEAFSLANPPGASRNDVELAVLTNGDVLVVGGSTTAAEIFDVETGTFSFTEDAEEPRIKHQVTILPTGQPLVTGGQEEAVEPNVYQTAEVFEPLAGDRGGFYSVTPIGPGAGHTTSRLDDGTVFFTGGAPCRTPCAPFPQAVTQLFVPSWYGASGRPVLATAPATAAGGQSITLTGSGFRGSEGSGGRSSSSPANQAIVVWQSKLHGAVVIGTASQWSPTSVTWVVPATGYTGPGHVRVVVNGVPTDSLPITIESAEAATPCAFGAECDSGFCADGVCCDTRCDGACEGCTAARKGSGDDGVCGEVPPERDPLDACVLSVGAPCDSDEQCSTGHCADGVCCQSECTSQCEACDVGGSVGVCVPVSGPPHGDRPSCTDEPPADPCDAPICDGVDRTTCAATVGPCTPYACGAETCLGSCEDDADCASGYHCAEGECVAGQCDGSVATTAEGDTIDCSPYICQADGSCRTSCADVSDCADPFACDFEGRCVARPPADQSSSCACSAPGTGPKGAGWGLAGFAFLAVVVGARRRRIGSALSAVAVMLFTSSSFAGPSDNEPARGAAPSDSTAAKEEAKRRFEKGLGFVAEKSWAPALAEFLESRRLHPTRAATQNAAFSLRQLGRLDEALDMYEAMLREYPDIDEAKKKEAADAITELRAAVGTIEIDYAEPGATIVIDGRERGTYPPAAPLRVAGGNHVVRVFKKGYEPFETRVDVAGRGVARVEAKLVQLKESGTLKVVEQSGKTLKVIVDQVEVGTTPFEGQLAVGKHVVTLRGEDGFGVAPTAAPIERDQTTALELSAVSLDAALRVEPTPAAALVTIDAVPVGRGTWEGPLPAGKHKIEITAEGFLAVGREINLEKGEPFVLSVPLERDEDDDRWKIPGKLTLEASGSFGLFPQYFGGTTNGCDDQCSSDVGLGGLAVIHAAYEFGNGLGIGITGGYISTTQSVTSRSGEVQPVGLDARSGRIDDTVAVLAGMVGAHVHYHFGEVVPVLVRLGVGAMLGETRDTRSGRFQLDDGFTYQAGPIVQDPFSASVYVDPEVRVAYPLTENFEVSLGLQALLVIAVVKPTWDPTEEVDAAVDGIGAFGGEDMTGPFWFVVAPGLGARYAF